MFTFNLNLSSPAAAPGLLSCGAPPGTSVLPPNTSGSSLSLWKIQTKEVPDGHCRDKLMKLKTDIDTSMCTMLSYFSLSSTTCYV